MLGDLIYDLLIILASGLLAGLICRRLQISVLVGYLVVGAIIGQGGLAWVIDDKHFIEHIGEAGVFLLLFTIGLEFSLEELASLGKKLLIGGSAQMLLVALPVIVALSLVGKSWQSAVLIAAAIAFSSTILVFKALSDSGHSSRPHGRRAIGILLFQDVALIPLLLLIPLLTSTGDTAGASDYLKLAVTSALFVLAVVALQRVMSRWIMPFGARFQSPDLLILFVLVSLGGMTLAAHELGLPAVVGAFAAGLVFSGNRWSHQIDALLLPFRETFTAIFFVSIGLLFQLDTFWNAPLLMLSLLAALVVLKAAAATAALWLTGLRGWSAIGMGIGLAHVGEFALLLVAQGTSSGILTALDQQRIIGLAIGSLILTPMLMKLGLRWTDASGDVDDTTSQLHAQLQSEQQALVVGAGMIGRQVASQLETLGKDVCVVDLSPINLHPFALQGFRTVAGDARDSQLLEHAGAADASLTVVCVPDDDAAIGIVRMVRAANRDGYILARCRYLERSKALVSAGADQVVSEEAVTRDALLSLLKRTGHD